MLFMFLSMFSFAVAYFVYLRLFLLVFKPIVSWYADRHIPLSNGHIISNLKAESIIWALLFCIPALFPALAGYYIVFSDLPVFVGPFIVEANFHGDTLELHRNDIAFPFLVFSHAQIAGGAYLSYVRYRRAAYFYS